MKDAVRQISGEDCEIVGASRTDSGTHAKGQVCHFDVSDAIEPTKWAEIFNRCLPNDVAVVQSELAGDEFHSRFCADWRAYRYRILSGVRDPLRLRYAHYHWRTMNLEAMQEAASQLVGEHDFRGYSQELDKTVLNTVRELHSVKITHADDEIWIDVRGNAFVKGMMRRISGMLMEIGLERRPIADAKTMLTESGRNSLQWSEVLPARGLTLMEVKYGDPPRDIRERHDEQFETDG